MPVDPKEMNADGGSGHITIHDLRRSAVTWLQQMRFSAEDRTHFKGSKPQGLTEGTYSQADREDIRRRCCEAIDDRIRDVEAGNDLTMFDAWKASKKVAGSAS